MESKESVRSISVARKLASKHDESFYNIHEFKELRLAEDKGSPPPILSSPAKISKRQTTMSIGSEDLDEEAMADAEFEALLHKPNIGEAMITSDIEGRRIANGLKMYIIFKFYISNYF